MDALESVFVPYRDVLSPKPSVPRPSSWRWVWIGVIVVLVGAGLWMAGRNKPSALQWMSDNNVWSPQGVVQKALVPNLDVPTKAMTNAVGPPLASIPKSIALIRGGAVGPVNASTPQDLAKQVGLAVKQTLLTFPSLSPEIVASIVQHTVRTILATPRAQASTPRGVTQGSNVPPAPVEVMQPRPTTRVAPRPTGGRVQLQGLAIPMVDDDDEIAPQEGGSKQKKINAESDPAVLRLMKERGIEIKS